MSEPDTTSTEEWVPLKVAAEATGVSVATLRKWYRAGSVPSRLEDGPYGPQKAVPLAAVLERAARAPAPSRGSQGPQTAVPGPAPIPGSALIPMADLAPLFDRLADAEQRAARYQAEAEFLREQLARRRADQEVEAPAAVPVEAPRRRRWFGR